MHPQVQWEAVGARFGIKKGSAQMRWYNLKNRLEKEEGASAGHGRASGSTSAKAVGNLNGNQGGKAKSGGNGKGVKRGATASAMLAGGGDKAAKRVKRGKGEGGYEGEVDTDDEEDWKKEEDKDDKEGEAKETDSEDDNDLVELKGGPVKVESD